MNAKQMLKAAGCSDTVAGRKKFHDMYPTPGHFFAKHGGELSGAPHNGQPTAAEFFAWGQPIVGPQGFYGDGGPVEYNRALALVTKAMGGQAGVEMRSTNDYLQNENGYLTDYLNQGQQQFMRNGGNLMQARYGYGDPGGPNAPEQGSSQSTNYSDGYTGNNNQNYNPYLVNQHSFTNGYTPYMGIFGALANTAGRVDYGIKKLKVNNYGATNYYGNQQGASGQGSSQGSSSPSAGNNGGGSSAPGQPQQNNAMAGYKPYMQVTKTGLFGRPKKFKIGYEQSGQGNNNPAASNNGAPGSGTPSGGGSMSPYKQGYMPGAIHGSSANGGKYMGPDMDEQDTPLSIPSFDNRSKKEGFFEKRRMNKRDKEFQYENSLKPYYEPTDEENNVIIPDPDPYGNKYPVPMRYPEGPFKANGMYRNGGVPQFVNGGSGMYTSHPDDNMVGRMGWMFNTDNLNPWQMEGAAQDFTGFLNNGQNQRIMNEQRERLQNPLSTTADLEYKGNQKTLDSNLVSNTRETGQEVNFAGESNVDGQIGNFKNSRYGGTMQGGGAVKMVMKWKSVKMN